MALSWQQIGMNNSVQARAVGDRRVHGKLTEAGVGSVSTMEYRCIITHKHNHHKIDRTCQFSTSTLRIQRQTQ